MSLSSSERLREALFGVEEARRREVWQRQVAEALLEGLHAVVMTSDPEELFPNLFEVLREPLGFESAGPAVGRPVVQGVQASHVGQGGAAAQEA